MWWHKGNTLALVEAIQKFAREADGGFDGQTHALVNSGLIGTARQIGMHEDDIREAFASDECPVIYYP